MAKIVTDDSSIASSPRPRTSVPLDVCGGSRDGIDVSSIDMECRSDVKEDAHVANITYDGLD